MSLVSSIPPWRELTVHALFLPPPRVARNPNVLYLGVCPRMTAVCAPAAPRHMRSVNVIEGEPNDRQMTTGNHTVRDIYCCKCGQTLGWKYVSPSRLLVSHAPSLRDRSADQRCVFLLSIRTTRTSRHRSTRRASTFSSATSSLTFSDRRTAARAPQLRRPRPCRT